MGFNSAFKGLNLYRISIRENIHVVFVCDDPVNNETCRRFRCNINNSNIHVVHLVGC